jgi:hypothetical protein
MAVALFDIAGERLEGSTGMDRLAARGTLRIALKKAGLDPQSLTLSQLRAVFEKLMPRELEARGVADPVAASKAAIDGIASDANEADLAEATSPDEIFKRLGGS